MPIKITCDVCDATCDDMDLYEYYDGTQTYLCTEHAKQSGFCVGCHIFYGGTEEFLISGMLGWCCECRDEIDDAIEPYGYEYEDEP